MIEVVNVYITKKIFIVNTYDGVYELKRNDFDEWATDNECREWLSVIPGHDGEPVEDRGTLPWREYYKSDRFNKDVAEFILKHDIKPIPSKIV